MYMTNTVSTCVLLLVIFFSGRLRAAGAVTPTIISIAQTPENEHVNLDSNLKKKNANTHTHNLARRSTPQKKGR